MNATTEPKTLSLTADERAQNFQSARTTLRMYGPVHVEGMANTLRRKGQDAQVHSKKAQAKRFLDMACIWRYVSTEEIAR